ncbi:MAG: alpha/beta fold hydrolase [Rhodoferax sp.]|nr:alpha/beta fold hydrolase [Rhodoferax sp.]
MNKTTIMLIHGAWMTPDCWSQFRSCYEARGYACVAPAWPYLERPVEALRRSPAPELAKLTIKSLVDYHESLIRALPEPPILIGHSFGGLIVQMLLDRGLGAAGVAIDAGPPRGVLPSFTAIRAALPVLLAWRGWRRVLTMSFHSFASTFANTLPAGEQRPAYDRYVVPAPGRIYFQAALGIGNAVDFSNPNRAPLLLMAGGEDRTSTPSMARAMYRKHSRSPVRTDLIGFPGRSHWLIAEAGWREVAEKALDWAQAQARQ